MIKAAGELLLAEGTEEACHMITDRWARCKYGGVYVVEAIRDPEEPDYDFVYCKKHHGMLQDPRTLARPPNKRVLRGASPVLAQKKRLWLQ